MAKPLGFLSFDVAHDEAMRSLFIEQAPTSPTPFSVDHWSMKAMRPRDDWDKTVQGNIGRCDFLIVLVGADTQTAEEVAREIQFAKRTNVPFFGVRASGSDESIALPPGLPSNRTIPWDWKRIAAAVTQLQAEGKHHVFT